MKKRKANTRTMGPKILMLELPSAGGSKFTGSSGRNMLNFSMVPPPTKQVVIIRLKKIFSTGL
jgi:hypothetical protein